jgi:hypothetical protein
MEEFCEGGGRESWWEPMFWQEDLEDCANWRESIENWDENPRDLEKKLVDLRSEKKTGYQKP